MVRTIKIDENAIAMETFTRIVKKCYKDRRHISDKDVCKIIKKALFEPEHFCKLDINEEKVCKKYDDLVIHTNIMKNDILRVLKNKVEEYDDIGNTPYVNAGKFLELLANKAENCPFTGQDFIRVEHTDAYYIKLIIEKLEEYDGFKDEIIPIPQNVKNEIAQSIKNELCSELVQELPKAMENCLYSMKQ